MDDKMILGEDNGGCSVYGEMALHTLRGPGQEPPGRVPARFCILKGS